MTASKIGPQNYVQLKTFGWALWAAVHKITDFRAIAGYRDGILERHFSRGFGHKLESSQTWVFVWFSTRIFPSYKMLFMKRRKFFCFPDFFVSNLKPREENGFLLKSASRSHCKYHGTKTRFFCQTYAQGFHLCMVSGCLYGMAWKGRDFVRSD